MSADFCGPLLKELATLVPRYDARFANMRFVETLSDGIERINVQPFTETRFIANEAPEFRSKSIGQSVRKRGEQNARIRIRSCQEDGAMQGNDRFAGSR